MFLLKKAVLTGLTVAAPDMRPVQRGSIAPHAVAASAYLPAQQLDAHPLTKPILDRYQDQSPQVHLT